MALLIGIIRQSALTWLGLSHRSSKSRLWGFEVILVMPPSGVKWRVHVWAFAVEILGSFYLSEALGAHPVKKADLIYWVRTVGTFLGTHFFRKTRNTLFSKENMNL